MDGQIPQLGALRMSAPMSSGCRPHEAHPIFTLALHHVSPDKPTPDANGMTFTSPAQPTTVVRRLIDALNRRDLEALIDCFDPDVRTEFPTQPRRGVHGREYIRAYWEDALEGAGEVDAKLFRCAADGDTVLSEWCWYGRRVDGSRFARRHDGARRGRRQDQPGSACT
jgi:limonene-1,2-epoxide hydrolase